MLKEWFVAAMDAHKVLWKLAVMAAAAGIFAAPSARAANIIDEWASVKAPPAPALKPVTVDPKTTALLMLDFLPPNCGVRPRCMAWPVSPWCQTCTPARGSPALLVEPR